MRTKSAAKEEMTQAEAEAVPLTGPESEKSILVLDSSPAEQESVPEETAPAAEPTEEKRNSEEEPVPEELRDIVGFVCEEKTDVDKAYIVAEIIKEFKKIYDRIEEREFFKEYNERLMLTGRRVTVLAGGTEKNALVLGTDNNLGLRVLFDDKTEATLTAGEVSIKL